MWPSNRLLFVIVVVCGACFVSAKNIELSRNKRTINNDCEAVKTFFKTWNVTTEKSKEKGKVCGGDCCGNEAENFLRLQGQKDFAALLRHNSRSLQGLLTTTATILQNHVTELSRQSENKTLLLFSQVYKGMSILSRQPIETLYSDMRNYIWMNMSRAEFSTINIDIQKSVFQFFTDLFPLVYHSILLQNTDNKDFDPEYKVCLKKTFELISPFGEYPQQIAQQLSKGLETTRALLQGFKIGSEVLNNSDTLLIDESSRNNEECHGALLRMTYCPKCLGLVKNTKPCAGYCLNVLRGCLTKYVAELDTPWNGYVEGIESLMGATKRNAENSIDTAIRALDTRISEALMRAMAKGKYIDDKVQSNCGPASFSDQGNPLFGDSSTPLPSTSKPRSVNPRDFPVYPEQHFLQFTKSLGTTRGFYANLADTLCQDESFVESKDQSCWNGERIAGYMKTVVGAGLDAQKYNPEVKPSRNLQNIDPRVAALVDKLRHVHHVAMSSVGPSTAEVDYMQRDGVEGSGSGNGPDFEDGDDEFTRGSGSGHGPIVIGGDEVERTAGKPRVITEPEVKHSDGSRTQSSLFLMALALFVFARRL